MTTDLIPLWEKFYRAATGCAPFQWHTRTVQSFLDNGRWPDYLVAPTGTGKSSVVYMHVFLTAAAGHGLISGVPRRQFTVVNRRALVDDHFLRAEKLAQGLLEARHAEEDNILGWVARGVDLYSGRTEQGSDNEPVLRVQHLRGGTAVSTVWREYPEQVQVICATPDMWGSRALFHGYGTSPSARPQEAALACTDAVVIVDEAHLCQQLTITARRIGELQAESNSLLEEGSGAVLPLQVVSTTATPVGVGSGTTVSVEDEDLAVDELLAARYRASKPLVFHELPSESSAKFTAELAVSVMDSLEYENRERPVLVVLNSVAQAMSVYSKVTSLLKSRDVSSLLIVGPQRAHDRARDIREHPYLYSASAPVNGNVRVVISTQTVEVGVDLDSAALITELPSASALAQRAGRVNRVGARSSGTIHVLIPFLKEDGYASIKSVYTPAELEECAQWVRSFDTNSGLSLESVQATPPPPAQASRLAFERLEHADVHMLARTTKNGLDRPPQLALWLSDDLGNNDLSVNFVVRDDLPANNEEAVNSLASERAVDPSEVFIPKVWDAEALVKQVLKDQDSRVFIRRHGKSGTEVFVHTEYPDKRLEKPGSGTVEGTESLVSLGDTVYVDSHHKIGVEGRVLSVNGTLSLNAIPHGLGGLSLESALRTKPVLSWRIRPHVREALVSALKALHEEDSKEATASRFSAIEHLRNEVSAQNAEDTLQRESELDEARDLIVKRGAVTEAQKRAAIAAAERKMKSALRFDGLAEVLDRALDGRGLNVTADVGYHPDGSFCWGLVSVSTFGLSDAETSVVTSSRKPVLLDQHGLDVAVQSQKISEVCAPKYESEAYLAGLYHDAGKRDSRFQQHRLGNTTDQVLAKSRKGPKSLRALSLDAGLPIGWRHEQLSAAIFWSERWAHTTGDPALVLRAVGTSHGYGRPVFPLSPSSLAEDDSGKVHDAVRELFQQGGWDEAMYVTSQRYGEWGAAILEAIVRAADHRVSAKGK